MKIGDLVANVTNLYRINNRDNWYTSSKTKSIVKLIHVVVANIEMDTSSILRGFSRKTLKGNYTGKISNKFQEQMLDEGYRRDKLNHEEECLI